MSFLHPQQIIISWAKCAYSVSTILYTRIAKLVLAE